MIKGEKTKQQQMVSNQQIFVNQNEPIPFNQSHRPERNFTLNYYLIPSTSKIHSIISILSFSQTPQKIQINRNSNQNMMFDHKQSECLQQLPSAIKPLNNYIIMTQSQEDQQFASPTLSRKTSDGNNLLKTFALENLEITTDFHLAEGTRECRICLQSAEGVSNQLVTPCKCTGSLRYVHSSCFLRWVDRQFQSKTKRQQALLAESGLQCEICKVKVPLSFTEALHCTDKPSFQRKYETNKGMFFLFVVFLAFNLGSMTFLAAYVFSNPINFSKQLVSSVVVICAFIFLVVTALVTAYNFTVEFLITTSRRIDAFKPRRSDKTQRLPKIHPIMNHSRSEELPL